MHPNPIDIIDQHAQAITRGLDIVVYALGGLYEQTVRENLTMQGVRKYWSVASDITESANQDATDRLMQGINDLRASLSASNAILVTESDEDTSAFSGVAYDAIGAFLTQAKVSYAKRLREIVAAKAFGVDTYQNDPRIMIRSGARWNFSDFAYLTVRQLLVSWYNEKKIESYARDGIEEFNLLTNDPELFYDTYRVEDYPNIAEELFHPRTTKLVGSPNVST